MRRFLAKLAMTGASLYLACAAACFFIRDKWLAQSELRMENAKRERLAKTAGARIILVGGSNLKYGVDSPRLERVLGRPVVNMGLHAGLGIVYSLNHIMRHVHPGDCVVVCPEFANFDDDGSCYGREVLVSLLTDIRPSESVELPFAGWLHHLLSVPTLGAKKILRRLKLRPGPAPEDLDRWNAQGDYTAHWSCEKSFLAPLDKRVRPDSTYKSPKAMEAYLTKVAEEVTEKGGRFVLLPPAYRRAAYLKNKAYYDALQRDLQENGIGFAKPIERYAFEDGLMYDTAYHLNGRGVALRTNLLAEDINEALANE